MHLCRSTLFFSRRAMSTVAPRIAIVGSGPSGFYAAKYLLKDDPDVRVDVIDALPNPYGGWPA
jgi:cation diffusion facilitator CzcD-associated flavoprotein CzcO